MKRNVTEELAVSPRQSQTFATPRHNPIVK